MEYKKDNRWGLTGREQSFGLAQIHLPDWPSVTQEQARDVDFALDFMASNLSEGKNIWSCKRYVE